MQLIIFRYMHNIEYVITLKSLVENTCSWWWIIQLRHYQNFPINFAIPSRIGNFRTWWRIVSKRNKIKHLERKPIWIWSDPDRLQHAIYGWLRSYKVDKTFSVWKRNLTTNYHSNNRSFWKVICKKSDRFWHELSFFKTNQTLAYIRYY